MTAEDLKQLENLLERLRGHLGGYRFCIVNGVVGENFQIGIYNERGEMIREAVDPTIEAACNRLQFPAEPSLNHPIL